MAKFVLRIVSAFVTAIWKKIFVRDRQKALATAIGSAKLEFLFVYEVFYLYLVVVVVFSFIKQLSDATDSKMGFTIKQFTEETRIH